MVVTSQCIGHRVIGLYVGADNVRRYFRKGIATIELQLDHLRIACGLSSHFWLDEPEIRDPRLCAWLESKHRDVRGRRLPVSMDLVPLGNDSFALNAAILKRLTNEPAYRNTYPLSEQLAISSAPPEPQEDEELMVSMAFDADDRPSFFSRSVN